MLSPSTGSFASRAIAMSLIKSALASAMTTILSSGIIIQSSRHLFFEISGSGLNSPYEMMGLFGIN
jgi:hypothetical protein